MDIILSKLFLAKSAGTLALAKFFSLFGEAGVIGLATIFFVIWWWLKQKKREAIFFGATMIMAGVLIYALKIIIARPRPEFALVSLDSFGFPSGHALGVSVFLSLLAWLSARQTTLKKKAALWGSAIFLILAISWSRLALGVHWATDIVGGWGIGAILVYISIRIYKKYLKKSQ